MAIPPFCSPLENGIRLAVRVTPRARRDSFGGIVEDAEGRPALAVRLAAPPVDGAANKALVAFLARALGVGRSSVRIVSGETARLKIVEVTGVSVDEVTRRLETGSA
jgi:uncharacterized protein (TIGR00251 family)